MREHIDIIKPTVHLTGRIAKPKQIAKRTNSEHVNLGSTFSGNGPKTDGRKAPGSTTLGLAQCDEFITPICLQTLYNINYKPVETKKNTFGIVEFTPQAFLQGDLGNVFSLFVS